MKLAAVILAGLIPVLFGLRWALPNAWHVNTYNCDENSPMASLQAMDPAKLDFNPVGEKTPNALGEGTFHLYTFAVSLKVFSMTGLLRLTGDKAFYYANIGEWGKLYLAGRALSAVYGALALVAVYLLARAMFGPAAALLAALFLALAPAHSVFSRFLLTNMAGLFWITLALLLMKKLMDTGEARWYLLAGAAAGFAVSTRYSAAPLILPFLTAHLLCNRRPRSIKLPLLGLAAMGAAFLIGTPYALLDHQNFLKGVGVLAGTVAGKGSPPTLPYKLLSVWNSMTEGLGMALAAASLAGLAFSLYRRTKDDLLLAAWSLPLLAIFVRAGEAATTGRMLPLFPFLALLTGRAAAAIGPAALRRGATALVLAELVLLQAGYARLMVSPDIRDEASVWLRAKSGTGISVGLLREPSWFSPGAVETHYRHPEMALLPGAKLVPLSSGDWRRDIGYDLLGGARPDLVVYSSIEASYIDEAGLEAALSREGYAKAAGFDSSFRPPLFRHGTAMPGMLFIPERIRIFARKGCR